MTLTANENRQIYGLAELAEEANENGSAKQMENQRPA